jgi:PIN domain nuclease of toxin-antitoxin system
MDYLLDTCAFLWLASDSGRLSARVRQLLSTPGASLFLSAVSAWEIAVKYGQGRLKLPQPPKLFVPDQRARHFIAELPLTEAAALLVANLPRHHKDPFDRILVCQALAHNLTIVTDDADVRRYPVPTLW